MKKYFFILFVALFIVACGSKKQGAQKQVEQDSMAVETSETTEGLIDDLESQFAEDSLTTDTATIKKSKK